MDQPTSNSTELMETTEPWRTLSQEFQLLGDGELLELYRLSQSSTALNEIVRRYSPLVASVIRRLISDEQDAEDAYQATFLAMVLSVRKIRKPDSLAAWLYGVAYRSAKKVRSLRRKSKQAVSPQSTLGVDLDSSQSPTEDPLAIIARQFQLAAMDEELSRLPCNLREALVEHYLVGNSVPEIAQGLNLSVTAVESRLKRGRKALRMRLAMRGVSLTVVTAACIRFQKDVVAASASPWSHRLLELVGNTGSVSPTLASLANTKTFNPQLVEIIQKELLMKPFAHSVFGAAGGLLVLCAIGMLGYVSAIANQQTGPLQSTSGNGNGRLATPLRSSAEDSVESVNFVLAQSGTTSGGDTGGVPAQSPPSKEVISKWERPSGPMPAWLGGGAVENEREIQYRTQLNDRIDFEFKNASLSEAVEYISKAIHVPFLLDDKALESESINADEEMITLKLKDAQVRNILKLILEPLQLTYVIEDEIVRVTSKKTSANQLRFYDLSYVLPDSSLVDQLQEGIENSIAPDEWINAGGTCTMNILGSMLVISAPHENHLAVERFLFEMSKQSPANLKPRVPNEKPTGMMGVGGMGGLGTGGGGMGVGGMGGSSTDRRSNE